MSDQEVKNAELDKEVYGFLTKQTDFVKMEQLGTQLGLFNTTDKPYHDTTYRLQLTRSIERINNSDLFDKFVIHNKSGVKIATEKEAELFITARYKEIFKMLKRTRRIEHKAGLNNQTDMRGELIAAFAE